MNIRMEGKCDVISSFFDTSIWDIAVQFDSILEVKCLESAFSMKARSLLASACRELRAVFLLVSAENLEADLSTVIFRSKAMHV